MSIEIESRDVLRLIIQFLKENNLTDSMKCLQKESGVSLNVVDNYESFINDIKAGKWDSVLTQVSQLSLPMEKMTMLYEQVFFELLESGDKEFAKEMLRSAEPLSCLRNGHIEKFSKYDSLCKKPYFNKSDVYEMGSSKEMRRQEVADAVYAELSIKQQMKGLTLLSEYNKSALKSWKPHDYEVDIDLYNRTFDKPKGYLCSYSDWLEFEKNYSHLLRKKDNAPTQQQEFEWETKINTQANAKSYPKLLVKEFEPDTIRNEFFGIFSDNQFVYKDKYGRYYLLNKKYLSENESAYLNNQNK